MSDVQELISLTARDIDELTALLRDVVVHGASVGYVLPVDDGMLAAYWRNVAREVSAGDTCLLVARREERIVGTAQLAFCPKPNGRHRAEVQKVLVHSACRRMGLGAALMRAADAHARKHARSLLVLDTETESAGQRLYETVGYIAAGIIPRFATDNSGSWVSTTYMYKLLDAAA